MNKFLKTFVVCLALALLVFLGERAVLIVFGKNFWLATVLFYLSFLFLAIAIITFIVYLVNSIKDIIKSLRENQKE